MDWSTLVFFELKLRAFMSRIWSSPVLWALNWIRLPCWKVI